MTLDLIKAANLKFTINHPIIKTNDHFAFIVSRETFDQTIIDGAEIVITNTILKSMCGWREWLHACINLMPARCNNFFKTEATIPNPSRQSLPTFLQKSNKNLVSRIQKRRSRSFETPFLLASPIRYHIKN